MEFRRAPERVSLRKGGERKRQAYEFIINGNISNKEGVS